MSNAPFKLCERDLDLIILEELHSDTGFARWMADRVGLPEATFVSAEHSVSAKVNAKWGETDVLAYFRTASGMFAVLIEDKIAAQFAERQAERYQERAREIVASGLAEDSMAILCAPQSYLADVPPDDPWNRKIAIEDLADHFTASGTFRGVWRANALRACLKRLSRTKSAGSDDIRRFSTAFKLYLNKLDEGFDHGVTGDNWGFIIRSKATPRHVSLAWKNGKGQVDLTFSDSHLGKASRVTPPLGASLTLGDGVNLKSDIFAIDVPSADVTLPFDEQLDVVGEVMSAARALLPIVPKVLASTSRQTGD